MATKNDNNGFYGASDTSTYADLIEQNDLAVANIQVMQEQTALSTQNIETANALLAETTEDAAESAASETAAAASAALAEEYAGQASISQTAALDSQDAALVSETNAATSEANIASSSAQIETNKQDIATHQVDISDNAQDISTLQDTTVKKDSSLETGSAKLPSGTTAERPTSPVNGYMRYNTDLQSYEGYAEGAWGSIGGGARGGVGNSIFYENDSVVTVDYTITTGKNAMTAGAVSISDGVTVTIPDGSAWSIV